MRCLGSSALVAVVGALVRRNCRDGESGGLVSQCVGMPRGRSGNFSESEPDPDVPASKMQMSDGIVAEKARETRCNNIQEPTCKSIDIQYVVICEWKSRE